MGPDDEDDDETPVFDEEDHHNDDGENMVIGENVSSVHVIGPKLRPRSIHFTGRVNGKDISVLVDGCCTHNFIKPAVAEKLSSHVHCVSPFHVFVGNGTSLNVRMLVLRCQLICRGTCSTWTYFYCRLKG